MYVLGNILIFANRIAISGLLKSFPDENGADKIVVNKVSFGVKEGQCFGLLGMLLIDAYSDV